MNTQETRTRFAPSPTGYMHIGNLRTALYAYLFAKHDNGKFILRIEDTDQKRFVDGAIELIYRTLKQTGLKHDEGPDIGGDFGPYVQSERKPIYKEYALKLVELGHAYYCFCKNDESDEHESDAEQAPSFGYNRHCRNLSKEEIEKRLAEGQSYVIRQKIPLDGTTTLAENVVYSGPTELDDAWTKTSYTINAWGPGGGPGDHTADLRLTGQQKSAGMLRQICRRGEGQFPKPGKALQLFRIIFVEAASFFQLREGLIQPPKLQAF